MASFFRVAARRFSTQPCLRQAQGKLTGPPAPHGEAAMWKKLFLFIAVPAMGFCTYNGFFSDEATQAHHRPEFIAFNHLRLRVKAFPWGDGNHSLFHSHFNALPEGYDEEEH